MSISREEFNHLSDLAQLRFNPEEASRIASDINRIIDFIRILEEVDSSEIQPLAHVHDMKNRLSDDIIHPSMNGSRAFSEAPKIKDSCFHFPAAISGMGDNS